MSQDNVKGADDLLTFAPEGESEALRGTWKVLIVDDDPEVHSVTTMVLSKIVFEGKGLEFLHAYTGDEGCRSVSANPDIAVVFMDVIMEADDAGLVAIRRIREEIGNRMVRLILRTGQPGQAPEEDVVLNYDINDYKAKSELTAQRLFTTLISALRAYRDLQIIETNRLGLRKIVVSSAGLFELNSIRMFVSGVLMQLTSLLGVQLQGILAARHGSPHGDNADEIYLLAATGRYETGIGHPARAVLPPAVLERINASFAAAHSLFAADDCVIYIPVPKGRPVVGYIHLEDPAASRIDTDLIEMFCLNVGIAFDNFRLFELLGQTQEAAVLALGKLAEFHDDFTGDHLTRVERLSRQMAMRLRERGACTDVIDSRFIEHFGLASALHDVGKVGVPRELLCKPGRLDRAEFEIMKQHATIGHQLLSAAAQKVDAVTYLNLAAEIALTHHERFDGSGYPNGLRGEQIPVSGRIVAVVDVYDALMNVRPYKQAWSKAAALDHMRQGAGSFFDPQMVAVLLEVVGAEVQ